MTNKTDFKKRARELVMRRMRCGMNRKTASSAGFISSLGTARDYSSCISCYFEWLFNNEIETNEQDFRKHIANYLEECSEIYSQSSLNQHRQALALVFQIKNLPRLKSIKQNDYFTRSYTWSEVKQIVKHQNVKNAFSTLIAYSSGIRAHELVTLRLATEQSRSIRRAWNDDLFFGVGDFVIYVVTGKGGLRRFVSLPKYLSEEFEKFRCEPIIVLDRNIKYQKIYDISYGQAFSQSFTNASKKALGYSNGAHGLRHSYVKRRVNKLLELSFSLSETMLIVSQEVGHFRPLITFCYMR